MKIKVFPPPFCNHDVLDERGWLTMEEGATLKDVLKLIRLPRPLAKIMMVKLNGLKPESMSVQLRDGDVIGFFAFITGG